MGAICGNAGGDAGGELSKKESQLVKPKIMEVYGDAFNPETRTILCLLEIANKGINYK